MERKHAAVSGVLTLVAVGVAAVALAVSGGQDPPRHRESDPAGQVEQITEPVAPTTEVPAAPAPAEAPQDVPDVPDNAPVNTPAETPVEQAPPPGVPYDSDGGVVHPNPPGMAPGQVAPLPPTQETPEPDLPVEQPVIPDSPAAP